MSPKLIGNLFYFMKCSQEKKYPSVYANNIDKNLFSKCTLIEVK